MKKQMIITMVVAAMLLLPFSSAFAIYNKPTEMLAWDPDRAQNGYNAFITGGKAWLVDMEGRVVNSWEGVDADPGGYLFALENGNWRVAPSPTYAPTGVLRAGGARGRAEEYTWEGERVWWMDMFDGWTETAGVRTAVAGTGTFRMHHDWQRMYNSEIGEWTYMVLIWVAKSEADADNMGVDPDLTEESRGTGSTWSPCALIEVLPDYATGQGGDIIWYWTFADHMVTTFDTVAADEWIDWSGRLSRPPLVVSSTTGATDSIQAHPELLDVNGMHYTEPDGPRADMQHCNSFDYDENTGYVAINAKASNEFFVLDHDGTFDATATANDWDSVGALARGAGGDFLYRFGNPGNYYSGEPAGFFDEGDMEMYGTHDIQYIWDYHWRVPMDGDSWPMPPATMALDGARNFLLFDNGCYNPTNAGSKILEVNPYILDGDGTLQTATYPDGNTMFVDPGPDALANTTGLERRDQVVWEHGGGNDEINAFYSRYISGCTRMPNGNTIVDAGSWSHFFEVTPDNDVVWEYVVPPADGTEFEGVLNRRYGTFRFHRFLSSHPALVGKNLGGGGTLTGRVPAEVGTVVSAPVVVTPPAPTGWGTSGLTAGEGGGGGAGGSGTGSGGSGAY
jgi:hypothetical protein